MTVSVSGRDLTIKADWVSRLEIRIIQLVLGHASIQQTQRYLNVTDEELRRGLEVSWKNATTSTRIRSLKMIGQWACASVTNLSLGTSWRLKVGCGGGI